MSEPIRDLPFDECVKRAATLILSGATVHQKWTCRVCKARNTMDVPNKFHKHGKCEDCGHITNIEKRGCGFLVIFGASPV